MRYSERMANLNGSATREILKVLADKTIISFAGGLPATECLPVADIADITQQILSERSTQVLQYGTTDGLPSARAAMAGYVSDIGVPCAYEDTLVVSGGQQGIDLMCKTFIDKGDVVLVQNPTYLATLQIIASYQGVAVGVNSSQDGLDLNHLESQIREHNPKLLYVVPTFSNPSGASYTEENRKAIAELTAKYNVAVLEDDPYSKLRYSGTPLKPLKSFDVAGNIVYLTSFSKVVSPGLRVGVAVGDRAVLRKLEICKQGADVHTSHLSQAIVEEYLNRGLLESAFKKNLPIYAHKKRKMAEELRAKMPQYFSFNDPDGGLFIWGQLPKTIDITALFNRAIANKVAFVAGSVFYANPADGAGTLRLNFSNSPDEKIEQGVSALAKSIGDEVG